MRACVCGCTMFTGKQKQEWNVLLDGEREWKQNLEGFPVGHIHGPYVCTNCGKEYARWEDIPKE